MVNIKSYLEKIRIPDRRDSARKILLTSVGITVIGCMLGILQPLIDTTPSNYLPPILQWLDIRNYFNRLAIWILLATAISIYAKTPLRAAINTFLFFISMVSSYYLYCNFVLHFLSTSYMMIWISISFLSFFLSYVCWYAKGNGIVAIIISAGIIGVLFSQAFLITQGFYVTYLTEVITWGIGLIILRRNLKEFAVEFAMSFVIAFFYQLVIPYYG